LLENERENERKLLEEVGPPFSEVKPISILAIQSSGWAVNTSLVKQISITEVNTLLKKMRQPFPAYVRRG